jgi:hypothetical protein
MKVRNDMNKTNTELAILKYQLLSSALDQVRKWAENDA